METGFLFLQRESFMKLIHYQLWLQKISTHCQVVSYQKWRPFPPLKNSQELQRKTTQGVASSIRNRMCWHFMWSGGPEGEEEGLVPAERACNLPHWLKYFRSLLFQCTGMHCAGLWTMEVREWVRSTGYMICWGPVTNKPTSKCFCFWPIAKSYEEKEQSV